MKKSVLMLLGSLLLVGCANLSAPERFELTLAHVNDHHSHLLPMSRTPLLVDGEVVRVETGGFARVVTKIKAIRQQRSNVLALHAGDAITGTLFYTLFDGVADAELMNQVCFDAFALGNMNSIMVMRA